MQGQRRVRLKNEYLNMANRIKKVTIEKLWGVKNISTELYDDVNIFIGVNGSNKTTFLSLIEAAV